MTKELGYNKQRHKYQEYIGKYIVVFPQHASNFSGKLIGIEDGDLVLKPFQGGEYDADRGVIRRLINKRSRISASDVVAIEPTTRKNLVSYCIFENSRSEQEMKREKREKK